MCFNTLRTVATARCTRRPTRSPDAATPAASTAARRPRTTCAPGPAGAEGGQLNESPQAQDPPAFGLSMVQPCFSMVSTTAPAK